MQTNRHSKKWRPASTGVLFAGVVCLAALCFTRAGGLDFYLPTETAKLKPGPGVETASLCLICHSADYISIQPRLTRAVWKAEVLKMQQKYGAPIATNLVDTLVDYLVKNYGQEIPPVAKPAN